MMLTFSNISRIFIFLGFIFLIIGGILLVVDKIGINKWKIPGDIQFNWGPYSCVFALGTSLLLSFLLTVILNLFVRLINR